VKTRLALDRAERILADLKFYKAGGAEYMTLTILFLTKGFKRRGKIISTSPTQY